jgi:hypothetical protein
MIPGGVPTNERKLIGLVETWIEQCRVSAGARAAYYRLMNAIAETGRYDGQKALINTLNKQLERVQANLYSPVSLKFDVEFQHPQQPVCYEQAKQAAKAVTHHWDRTNTDMLFGRGVFESLKYGACILKQWATTEGAEKDEHPVYQRKLVMPWNFGVYREDENDLDKQEIICETSNLTLAEVWQRIYRFPDRDRLYERIKSNATQGGKTDGAAPTNFFHQVLSTSQISTGVTSATLPGGLVQIANDPNYAIMGPTVAADMVEMHELWVKDDDDYTTIQFIEPDILLAPHTMRVGNDIIVSKKENLLIRGSRMQPYRLIQPNEVTNWFWGRSELVDLIEPQMLLAAWADDFKRLFGLQVDKILAFIGYQGIGDELYDQFRAAGYMGMPAGSSIEDLTPKIPPEMLPAIKWLLDTINWLGNFPPVMQGQGEEGVRAQGHADALIKMASSTLLDRSLLVERQCATAADLTLSLMEAKDGNFYYTKADKPTDVEATKFLLSQLPDDWRVVVDSHSSSPVFIEQTEQRIFTAFKAGIVGPEYVIDNISIPNKEAAILWVRKQQEQQAQQFEKLTQTDPDLAKKIMEKKLVPHHR